MKAFNKLCLDRSSLPKLFLERVGRSEKQKRPYNFESSLFYTCNSQADGQKIFKIALHHEFFPL